MTGLHVSGGAPGGYGPGGGAPPGGGYGPPPGGGGFGGPPQGGGFGGPPQGGGYGGPPAGGYGGPPMPPMQPSPPQKQGPNVGLIVGLGCLGLFVVGGILVGALAFVSYRRTVSAISAATTAAPPPRLGSTAGLGAVPAEGTSTLKAELRDLRDFKGTFGTARYFVGEIYNTGDAPIGYPSAKVTLVDASGTAIDSGTCASVVHALPVGEKVPCTFLTLKSDAFATTKIAITPMRAYTKTALADLKVEGIKFTPKKGYSPNTLEGKITNQSSFKAKSVWALVSMYGADGKIVGAEQALVAGSDLDGGSSALFSAKLYNVAATPVTYTVKAVGYGE